jgi:hypothetical protein
MNPFGRIFVLHNGFWLRTRPPLISGTPHTPGITDGRRPGRVAGPTAKIAGHLHGYIRRV